MGQSFSDKPSMSICGNYSISSRERAKAAILGGFVADAATWPLHWIYDQRKVEELVKVNAERGPEFYSPPACMLYDIQVGELSPYGDEVVPFLHSLVEKGFFDLEDARERSYQFCGGYQGRLNKLLQGFLERRRDDKLDWEECSSPDDLHFLAVMKVPIIVARYAGNPQMIEKLDQAVRIHQTSEKVLSAARLIARILEKVILGSTVPDSIQWAKESELSSMEDKEYFTLVDGKGDVPFSVAAESFGLNGHIPGCLLCGIFALNTFRGYSTALRANIAAAGNNIVRAWIIGILIAAEQGLNAIPQDWKMRTAKYEYLEALSNAVVSGNAKLDSETEKSCTIGALFL